MIQNNGIKFKKLQPLDWKQGLEIKKQQDQDSGLLDLCFIVVVIVVLVVVAVLLELNVSV